jgi:hypothetical protein
MGKAISAAEETLASIVIKTLLGLLDSSVEGKSRGRASLILLQALVKSLHLILLALGKCFALRARGESGNIGVSGIDGGETESKSESSSSGSSAKLLAGILILSAANNASSGQRALSLGTVHAKGGSERAPATKLKCDLIRLEPNQANVTNPQKVLSMAGTSSQNAVKTPHTFGAASAWRPFFSIRVKTEKNAT